MLPAVDIDKNTFTHDWSIVSTYDLQKQLRGPNKILTGVKYAFIHVS